MNVNARRPVRGVRRVLLCTSLATLSLGARFDSFGRDAEFAEIAPPGTVIPDTVHSERNERIEGGGYGLLNANVRWAPSSLRGAELALAAPNLLDERYYSYYGTNTGLAGAYPGRRRELVVSLRYRP